MPPANLHGKDAVTLPPLKHDVSPLPLQARRTQALTFQSAMALVRILVDGYSLLHAWPDLARGHARYSETARNELVHILNLYCDAIGTPISVFFDGTGPKRGRLTKASDSTNSVEVLYSRSGQTADQMIERVTHRMRDYGEVLVVTDDFAERDTVIALGGMASNCPNFIESLHQAMSEQKLDINRINRRERTKFKGHLNP